MCSRRLRRRLRDPRPHPRRRPPATGIDWVEGALDDRRGARRLVAGADAVVHVAGLINAPDRAGFEAVNVGGTRR